MTFKKALIYVGWAVIISSGWIWARVLAGTDAPLILVALLVMMAGIVILCFGDPK